MDNQLWLNSWPAFALVAALGSLVGAPVATAQCGEAFEPGFHRPGMDGSVLASVMFDDGSGPALYAAGNFATVDAQPISGIARWSGAGWIPVGGGIVGTVQALTVFDDGGGPALFAGGTFQQAGGVSASNLARWDGRQWAGVGGGVNGTVATLHVHQAGVQPPSLFVGGLFTHAGGTAASNIARWDGVAWSALGSGIVTSPMDFRLAVLSMASFDDDGIGPNAPVLYVGGRFSVAGGITSPRLARWNGSAWSAVGTGLTDDGVHALLPFDEDGPGPSPAALFVGGSFPSPIVNGGRNLFRWSGVAWTSVGGGIPGTSGSLSDGIRALASIESSDPARRALFVAGRLTTTGSNQPRDIYRWNGSQWSALGDINNSQSIEPTMVRTLALCSSAGTDTLFAGGDFTLIEDLSVGCAALWNGIAWTTMGGETKPAGLGMGLGADISSFAWHDDGNGPVLWRTQVVDTWNGISLFRKSGADATAPWEPVHFDPPRSANQLLSITDAPPGPGLYLASSGSAPVLRWNGLTWSEVGDAPLGTARALVVFDDHTGDGPCLFASGFFLTSEWSTSLIRWNGSSWNPVLPYSFQQNIRAMAVYDDGISTPALYVTGFLFDADGVPVNHIAKFDGRTWTGLGSGLTATANPLGYDLAVFDDGTGPALYVAGRFSHAGGMPCSGIARWNGMAWSAVTPLGSPSTTAGEFLQLTVLQESSGSSLYTGGYHMVINGTDIGGLARWDGEQWTSVGGGVDGSVLAIVGDSNGASRPLTIGGVFRAAGTTISHNIAVLPDAPCCFGDVDQSGAVNVQDLLAVIGAWGACGNPNDCPADIAPPGPPQGDEMVNVADLLAVISQWGPC